MPAHFQPNQDNSSNFDRQLKKGVEFEKYVVQRFNPNAFTLLEWQGDKTVDNIVPVSYKRPDLLYRFDGGSKKAFLAVECKYRSALDYNRFSLKPSHFDSYMDFLKKFHIKIFIALGIGGTADNPSELFVIPFLDIPESLSVYKNQLLKYQHPNTRHCFNWDVDNHLLC